MQWLIPSMAVDFGFKLAICLILFLNYFENKEKFILYWAFGWAVYALNIFFELMLTTYLVQLPETFINVVWFLKHLSWSLMGVIFLKSILIMRDTTASFKVYALITLSVLSASLGVFVAGDWFWAALPSSLINGLSLVVCALYFKKLKPKGPILSTQLIFYGFLLNGLHNLDYPFLRHVEWFAPWGFSICAVLSLVFALGLIIKSSFINESHKIHATETAKELATIYSINSMFSRTFELDTILKNILEKVSKLLKMEAGIIYLLDEKEKLLVPKANLNVPPALKERLSYSIKPGEGWSGEVFELGEMKIISNASCNKKAWPETKKEGLETFISVPLKARKKVIGIIEFGTYAPRVFSQEELRLLSSIASEIAITIENAKLYSSIKKTASELSTLHNISLAVTSYLDMDSMLNEVLKRILKALNVTIGAVYVLNEKSKHLVMRGRMAEVKDPANIEELRVVSLDSNTLTAQVARTKKPLCVKDVSFFPTSKQEALIKEGVRGYCGVPILSTGGKIVGVLAVATRDDRSFKDEESQLLASIANEIGPSIENAKLYEDLQDVYLRSVTALAEVVDAKDHYTYNHSKVVTNLAIETSRELGLEDKDIEHIRKACQLHDIGKLSISDYILNKKEKLNRSEWKEIKNHALKGAAILEPLTFLKEPAGGVIEIVKQHHERYDGKGYPFGIKGGRIKLGARIMAVADAYHAMISARPYRKAFTHKRAIEELKKCSGTQFDPKIVEAFLRVLAKKNKYRPKRPKKKS